MNIDSGEISITQRLSLAKAEDFNDAQAEAFADRMVETLNFATLALMISVGHRTRLFDVMVRIDPATSEQIARAARGDGDRRHSRILPGERDLLSSVGVRGFADSRGRAGQHRFDHAVHSADRRCGRSNRRMFSERRRAALLVSSALSGGLAGESVEGVAPALSTLMESILPLVPGMAEAICTPGDSA
jgi:hypothetical protein